MSMFIPLYVYLLCYDKDLVEIVCAHILMFRFFSIWNNIVAK